MRSWKRAQKPKVRVDVVPNPEHVDNAVLPDDPVAAIAVRALSRCFPRYRAEFRVNEKVVSTWDAETEDAARAGLWASIEHEAREYCGVDFQAFAEELRMELRWTMLETQALAHALVFPEHRIYQMMGVQRRLDHRRGRPVAADRRTREAWCLAEAWCRATGGSPSVCGRSCFARAATIAARHLKWRRRNGVELVRQVDKFLAAEFRKIRDGRVVFTPQYLPVAL